MSASKTAVVTGAGSGVGRAVALALAKRDWRVALLGRRAEMLDETIQKAGDRGPQLSAYPCDIGDNKEVELMAKHVLSNFKEVDVLVNAAGTNAPRRSLELLSFADYHRMLDTNLNGAYYCLQAFLPGMRRQGSGTIINVISEAGRQASPKAGVAYVISKFGLTGLTQAINAEERSHGIRACAIFPGDIDTPILDKRPVPPLAEARKKMLHAEDVAECALLAIDLPPRAVVEEILIRPR